MFSINEWYEVDFTGEVTGTVTGRCVETTDTGIILDDGTEQVIVKVMFSNGQGTVEFPFPSDDVVSVEQTS